MANQYPPPTPGSVLRMHLRREGGGRITQNALADAMRMSRVTVNEIVNDHRAVTPDVAVRLGHVLGTTAEMWMNLQVRSDLVKAHQRLEDEPVKLKVLREPGQLPPLT